MREDDLVRFVTALNAAVLEAVEAERKSELEDVFDEILIVCLRHGEVVLGGAVIVLRELFRAGAVGDAYDALSGVRGAIIEAVAAKVLAAKEDIGSNGPVDVLSFVSTGGPGCGDDHH